MSALPPAAATEASAPPPTAGWFGKIPALGDFVSRRLPPEFIEPWDEWLSEELFAAREKLGEDWLESYLKAPIWRFALMPGVLDDRHWFGVLMPSVDRVGRQFPLTFAASFAPESSTFENALEQWWNALSSTAMRVRDPGLDADALEQALSAAQGEAPQAAPPAPSRIAQAVNAAAPGTSLWSCRRAPELGEEILWVVDGLARGDQFVLLIRPEFAS